MQYEFILHELEKLANGPFPENYSGILNRIAKSLLDEYNVEPVDIIAAKCLADKKNVRYARILLRRAYSDLENIGKKRGWLI